MDIWHVINVGGDVWYESDSEVIAVESYIVSSKVNSALTRPTPLIRAIRRPDEISVTRTSSPMVEMSH